MDEDDAPLGARAPTTGDPASEPLGRRVLVTFEAAVAAYTARGLFPVPAKGAGKLSKQPKFCHKYDAKKLRDNELWTRARAKAYGRWHECQALGLLLDARRADQAPGELRGLLVLDFDTHALFQDFARRFTEFGTCPLVRTLKGYHAYFMRSRLCDAMALTDGARQFENIDGTKLELDIKSYTKSGTDGHSTAGFISVPPTAGKEWVRNICTVDPQEISDELVGFLRERKVAAPNKKPRTEASGCTRFTGDASQPSVSAMLVSPDASNTVDHVSRAFQRAVTTSPSSPEASQPPPPPPAAPAWWHVGPERAWQMTLPCLRAMGFKTPDQMSGISNPNERSREFGYKFGFQFFDHGGVASGPCVLCGKPDNHTNNSFRVFFRTSATGSGFDRMVKNYSEHCVPVGQRTRPMPFSPEGARAWTAAWLPACSALPEATCRAAAAALGFTADGSGASAAGGGWTARAVWVRDGRLVFLPRDPAQPARVVDLRAASTGRAPSAVETPTPWAVEAGAKALPIPTQPPSALLSVLADALRPKQ